MAMASSCICTQLLANREFILADRLLHCQGRLLVSRPDLAWTTSPGPRITGPQAGAAGEAWGCLGGA